MSLQSQTPDRKVAEFDNCSCDERFVLKSDWEWSFSTVLTAWPLKSFIMRPGFFSWFYCQASTLFPVLTRSLHGFLTCKMETLAFTVFKHTATVRF